MSLKTNKAESSVWRWPDLKLGSGQCSLGANSSAMPRMRMQWGRNRRGTIAVLPSQILGSRSILSLVTRDIGVILAFMTTRGNSHDGVATVSSYGGLKTMRASAQSAPIGGNVGEVAT